MLVVLTLRLLLVQVVRTLLAAVALPPHGGGAVGHAPVLVSVGGRPRVQPEINCRVESVIYHLPTTTIGKGFSPRNHLNYKSLIFGAK